MENQQQLLTDYLQMSELDKELRSRAKNLQRNLDSWVFQVGNLVGKRLQEAVKSTLPIEEKKWKAKNYESTGKLHKESHYIKYSFRIDDYMIDKINEDFPDIKLNTRKKHTLRIHCTYDIIQNKFSIELDFLYFTNLFNNNDLYNGMQRWIWHCVRNFDYRNISLDETIDKISELKELFDSYVGFYIAEKLS